MKLRIDPGSSQPPFDQIRTQIMNAARDGSLATGTKLPTVRRLADDLGLAPNTVAKAYRQLELDGVIETRGRAGSFVASWGDGPERQARDAASSYAARIRELGLTADDGVRLARAALDGA